MSLFGFAEATSVAAWTAVTLVCLPLSLLYSKSAELRLSSPTMPSWIPRANVQFGGWFFIGAGWVVGMFYLTKIAAGDSWQLIVGISMFLFHALLVRTGSVLFWKMNKPKESLMVGVFALLSSGMLTAASFSIAITDTTNFLYFIPGFIFGIYTLCVVLPAVVANWNYTKKHSPKNHNKDHHHHHHKEHDDDYVVMPEERRGREDGTVVHHIPRR